MVTPVDRVTRLELAGTEAVWLQARNKPIKLAAVPACAAGRDRMDPDGRHSPQLGIIRPNGRLLVGRMSGRRTRGIDDLAAACRLLGQRGGMPSFRHEAPLVLFRECPELVARLIRELFGVVVPDYRQVRVVDADFTQLVPTSFHADLVLRFDGDAPVMGVVVERQIRIDDDKRRSWPLYTAALHAKLACQICLVVIAETNAVAAWAARPIDTLQIGSPFVPLVLGPRIVPRITSAARAAAEPELAVFSALVHGNGRHGLDVVVPALSAVEALPDDYASLYFDIIVGALTEARRHSLNQDIRTSLDELLRSIPIDFLEP